MFYKFVGEGGTEAEVIPYDPWRAVEHIRNSFASDRLAPYFTASSTAPGMILAIKTLYFPTNRLVTKPRK